MHRIGHLGLSLGLLGSSLKAPVSNESFHAGAKSFSSASFTRRLPVLLKYLAGVGVSAGAIWASSSSSEQLIKDVRVAYLVPTRLVRDVIAAASIVTDYKLSLRHVHGAEREEALHGCHQRSAEKLLKLCFDNGGVYIKLGQHVGQLDHLLPEEYVLTMRRHLLDKCPVSPLAEVRRIIETDLGAPLEQLYATFNPQPIASASLAQVHEATSMDGRRLAVKVQHVGLRETAAADIRTIQALVTAARWLFPTFDYQWLVEEVKGNLPKELDFKHEAANAERCRANLKKKTSRLGSSVHVPEVVHSMTSHRVLTMEFIDGAGVTDLAALRRLRIPPREVARLVAEAFNEMIFIHGDVHCDPHAANMIMRRKDGRPQLVLLDHGLYRQVDDKFRTAYAGLWRALIFADEPAIRRHATEMGAGDTVELFAGLLTQRPWQHVVNANASQQQRLKIPNTREHRLELQGYAQQYAVEITTLLQRMPRPLLLLLKTNDCLRCVDAALGQPANTFVITARECTRALALQRSSGITSGAVVAWEMMQVEVRMIALSLLTWLAALQRWWQGEADVEDVEVLQHV